MELGDLFEGSFDSVDAIRLLAFEVATLRTLSVALVQPTPVTADRHIFYDLLDGRVVKVLLAAGLDDIESVRKAGDDTLLALNGIGPSTLLLLREVMG